MRNHTPPNEAYDPNVATFRIPHNMTKTDLRSYLSALYGMTVTFIRTDNYFPAVKRMPGGGQVRVPVGSMKSYKCAVVGLTEPFHYPDDVDELYAQGEKMGLGTQLGDERKEWIESNFQVGMLAEMKKKALMKFHKGYRWRSKTHDNPVRFPFLSLILLPCLGVVCLQTDMIGQCRKRDHEEETGQGSGIAEPACSLMSLMYALFTIARTLTPLLVHRTTTSSAS